MNPLRANFDELYHRHLCRHSQFGINLLHLIAVTGIYISLLGIAFAIPFGPWIAGGLLAAYLLVLAFNIPLRVLVLNVAAIGCVLGLFLLLPKVPVWVHLILILCWHRFQVLHHHVYDESHDMSEFAEKYRKGPVLFVLLAIYELPILLNFLVFDSRKQLAA